MPMKDFIILVVCYFVILVSFCLVVLYSLDAELISYELQEADILDKLNLREYR